MAGTRKHMNKIASSGGLATKDKYGKDHFRKIAILRWIKEKEIKAKK